MLKSPVVIDIETDDLRATKVHVVVTKEVDTGETKVWTSYEHLPAYLRDRILIGHNILGFDLPVLRNLLGVNNTWGSCIDTLVVSRLRDSWNTSDHSLEAWGERLGYHKIPFTDFSNLTQEMIDYCIRDVEIAYKLYDKVRPFLQEWRFRKSVALEHHSAYLCQKLNENGFHFDYESATILYNSILEHREKLLEQIHRAFPPRTVLVREIIPRATKSGSVSRVDFRWLEGDEDPERLGFSAGSPFSRYEYKEFNPNSTKDRIEVLWEAGWKPKDKTKGHLEAERTGDKEKLKKFEYLGWKVNEENLSTLPSEAPVGARLLAEYIVLDSRRSTLEEWFRAYNHDTGRIHGNIHHIGAWTHRKSHSNPNKANIPSPLDNLDSPTPVQNISILYNGKMRECWTVPERKLLVGVDAEAIQLRVLAHYIGNESYTKAIHEGVKELETDIHSVNKRALGLSHLTRDHAKTFIYAWLLGAGTAKVADILQCSLDTARGAMQSFFDSVDGLAALKFGRIPKDAARGYFLGLDGRYVKCDSEHLMLAGYLQNGESVIMKWANRIWERTLTEEGIWFKQVNDVHDEWQTEVEEDEELAEYIKQVQINSIVQAGEELGLRCPLAGSGNIGKTWKDTH